MRRYIGIQDFFGSEFLQELERLLRSLPKEINNEEEKILLQFLMAVGFCRPYEVIMTEGGAVMVKNFVQMEEVESTSWLNGVVALIKKEGRGSFCEIIDRGLPFFFIPLTNGGDKILVCQRERTRNVNIPYILTHHYCGGRLDISQISPTQSAINCSGEKCNLRATIKSFGVVTCEDLYVALEESLRPQYVSPPTYGG